ncbi:MAG TPA: A/G-specific adenine glycosylase [Alphaproteobacteria bacterium]|nr:A/G-specific adenine glycosylase [Alphaproteobacteria bacterium]
MQPAAFQSALLKWYGAHKRALPWRATQNPYHLLVAETMLQQTTVATVLGYYEKFLKQFPTVQALGKANIADVLHLWQGLGYYRRAHNMHKGAQVLATQPFPTTEAELLAIPGIGPYTAAVLAATAFNTHAVVVDGNVERVMARLFAVAAPLPKSKPVLRQHAAQLASANHPRAYANAIMELGALVCTPRTPNCSACPVQKFCKAYKQGTPTAYPVKDAKKKAPHHTATAYVLRDAQGNIYLQQRPDTGLLSSLWELPHEGWEKTPLPKIKWHHEQPAGSYTHTFTHFKLTLNVVTAQVESIPAAHRFALKKLPPLSTLMKNALRAAGLGL